MGGRTVGKVVRDVVVGQVKEVSSKEFNLLLTDQQMNEKTDRAANLHSKWNIMLSLQVTTSKSQTFSRIVYLL